jgi:hypothetical protein
MNRIRYAISFRMNFDRAWQRAGQDDNGDHVNNGLRFRSGYHGSRCRGRTGTAEPAIGSAATTVEALMPTVLRDEPRS